MLCLVRRGLWAITTLLLTVLMVVPSAMADAGRATLLVRVQADQVPAQVSVDGRDVGETPVSLELAVGDHEMVLHWQGQQRTSSFRVRAGDRAVFEVSTDPVPDFATIDIEVEAAQVIVDGESKGPAPVSLEVAPGRHRVQLRWSDGSVATRDVSVAAGARARVRRST